MSASAYLEHVMFNGLAMSAEAVRISPLSDGFMFGHGLFETIRVIRGRLVFFEDHAARLARSSQEIGLGTLTPAEELRARCQKIVTANRMSDGCVKVVVFKDSGHPGELIVARSVAYAPEVYARGFRLKTVTDDRRVHPLHTLKTVNYLKNISARHDARSVECDDALFVDDTGRVLEGAATNVFIVKGAEVFTPAVNMGILPGVARARVVQLLKTGNLHEEEVTLTRLREADEVFVTNALLGIMAVSAVDDRAYDIVRNPVTKKLQASFNAQVEASVR